MWYNRIYMTEYCSAIKNQNIMNFVGIWMELENITLSEVTQPQKEIHGMCSLKWILTIKYRYHATLHRPKEAKQEGRPKQGCLNLS